MSFFPDPQRQGDIKFIYYKKLSYMVRIKFVLGFLSVGLLLQLFFNFWLGLLFVVIGNFLSLIEGYAATPSLKRGEEWGQVTPDEYSRVKEKQKQLKKWDLDCLDFTNALGAFVFFVIAGACCFMGILLLASGPVLLAKYWFINVAVIFIPHWMTGVKSFLRKDKLIIKIDLLQKMIKYLESPSDVHVLPMLSTQRSKEGGRVPKDARLMVKSVTPADGFLGLQIQVSLNNVQGKDYPYLYCVLLAKRGKQYFMNYDSLIGRIKNITFKKTYSDDVDVLVIRQKTTRTSGYHTNIRASKYVVQTALDVMKLVIKRNESAV